MSNNPDEDTISALVPSGDGAEPQPTQEAVNVAVASPRPSDHATSRPSDLATSSSTTRKASLAKQEEPLSPEREAPALSSSGSYNSVKIKPSLDSSSEVDEFQGYKSMQNFFVIMLPCHFQVLALIHPKNCDVLDFYSNLTRDQVSKIP